MHTKVRHTVLRTHTLKQNKVMISLLIDTFLHFLLNVMLMRGNIQANGPPPPKSDRQVLINGTLSISADYQPVQLTVQSCNEISTAISIIRSWFTSKTYLVPS
jgi:hypothetical protein